MASSPGLSALGSLAVQHHERLDGSGYPRGLKADSIGPGGRVLTAADVYRTKTEPRPHREISNASEAARHLRSEVRADDKAQSVPNIDPGGSS